MPKVLFISISLPRALLLLGAALALIAFAGLHGERQRTPVPALAGMELPSSTAEVGKPAPDFTLEDLEGRAISLSSYRGRPVILYFWATWCSYCINDLPQLSEVYQRYRSEGLEVLAIDILEVKERVARTAAELELAFPVLLDTDARASTLYAVRATPTYVFIDRSGVVREVLIGSPRPGAVEGRLAPLLKPLEEESAP